MGPMLINQSKYVRSKGLRLESKYVRSKGMRLEPVKETPHMCSMLRDHIPL